MGGVFIYSQISESGRTARLLNSQAMNLDVVDVSSYSLHHLNICSPDSLNPKVISLVLPDWPLSVMSSFHNVGPFRRTLHAKHEWHTVKAISAGQNFEVRIRIVSCQMYYLLTTALPLTLPLLGC
jgi:vacuolar protein sorting-associated protein 3